MDSVIAVLPLYNESLTKPSPKIFVATLMQVAIISTFDDRHGPGSKNLKRAQMTLHSVQCHLDNQGASNLIVDLVIKSATSSPRIFSEVVEFGIALLEGGNQDIQKTLFNKLCSGDTSQAFFKVFYDKMYEAQQEIKSTVTVNTSDMSARLDNNKVGFFELTNQ